MTSVLSVLVNTACWPLLESFVWFLLLVTIQNNIKSIICDRAEKNGSFTPTQRLLQMFPELREAQASALLSEAGVASPDFPVEVLQEADRRAIQGLVDELVKLLYPDPGTIQDTKLECSCCYEDVEIEEMVSCKDEGHLFCVECVRKYAEEMVFGSGSLGKNKETGEVAMELVCMDADCTSCFPQSLLCKALPGKVLERYGELQGVLNVEKAKLDLW